MPCAELEEIGRKGGGRLRCTEWNSAFLHKIQNCQIYLDSRADKE